MSNSFNSESTWDSAPGAHIGTFRLQFPLLAKLVMTSENHIITSVRPIINATIKYYLSAKYQIL